MQLKVSSKRSMGFLFFFSLLVFVILFVSAQEETGETVSEETVAEQPAYDYANYNNYQNPEFYRDPDSDPSQWDWTQVNWAVFDFERADVYDVREFYRNLPAEGYSDLNYLLVPDFRLILDFQFIDGTKYLQDFGCEACVLNNEYNQNLLYTEDGRILTSRARMEEGRVVDRRYIFAYDFPRGTTFSVEGGEFIIHCPENAPQLCAADRGYFTVDTAERTLEYQGYLVNGRLNFHEGFPFLRDEVTINGIQMTFSGSFDEEMAISFSGEELADERFISLNEEQGIIQMHAPRANLVFLPGNHFFEVQEGQILELHVNDGAATIQKREGLIPLVTIISPAEATAISSTIITNGGTRLDVTPEGVFQRPLSREPSVPLTLRAQDEQGNPLIGIPEHPERIVFTADNRYYTIGEEFPSERVEAVGCTRECFISVDTVRQDYYRNRIMETTNIETLYVDPNQLDGVLRQLENLPPAIRMSITGINTRRTAGIFQCRELEGGTGACTLPTREIHVPAPIPEFFRHEGAHALTFRLEQDFSELETNLVAQELEMIRTYGFNDRKELYANFDVLREEEQEALQRLTEELRFRTATPFRERWESVARDALQNIWGGESSGSWPDGGSEPRYGCFTAYGCANYQEDSAEATEAILSGETETRQLIDPSSPFYLDQMGQEIGDTGGIMTPQIAEEWARRYRERVDLLVEFGFITKEMYNEIISE